MFFVFFFLFDFQIVLVYSSYCVLDGFEVFLVGIYYVFIVLFFNVVVMCLCDWCEKLGYIYGLYGILISFVLEVWLVEIEGGIYCCVIFSGLVVIVMVNFVFLKMGDDVLLLDNVYGFSKDLGQWLECDFGIIVCFYDLMIGVGLVELIQFNICLVWIEVFGLVLMEVFDILVLCCVVYEKGVLVVIDNIWVVGIVFKVFEYGVDIVM